MKMETINEKTDNGIISKFNPIARTVSLFNADDEPLKRKDFDEWALDYPMRVVIDIESLCNSGCEYCSYGGGKKDDGRIPREKVFEIIDELDKMKVFELSLRGGEPTIHPNFQEIWDYAQSKKFLATNIITNGLILDYEKAKKLLKNSTARIIISLDGFPEVNKHRNPKQYELVMSWLPATLKEFPYQIAIITCLYRDSEIRAVEFSEYLAGLGLKFHDFSPLRKNGSAKLYDNNNFLSFEEMNHFQERLNGIKDKFPDFRPLITCGEMHKNEYQNLQNFPVPLFNETYRSTTARITVKGDVLVSTRMSSAEYIKENIKEKNYLEPLGNIFKDSFENIWLSSKENCKKQTEIFYKNSPIFLGWK